MDDEARGAGKPRLPGYEVLHRLGQGASGTVWAVRRGDGVRFAAKVVAGGAGDLDHEAGLLQSIDHEHVVRLVDVLTTTDEPPRAVLVTELAEGGSLADALRHRGRLTAGELVTVICPVARALHDLHGRGLVHADLSPGNVLLRADGKPLIADLGVSRLAGHVGEQAWATESWAAPEVLNGHDPLPASDVYSLGAIAWAALTGVAPERPAFRPELATLAPQAPAEVVALVEECLAHEAGERPTAGDLALRLWPCAAPEPAPVAGSAARRGAQPQLDADPGQALTRRLRAQAREQAPPPPAADARPWWRHRQVAVTAVVGGLLGAVVAAGSLLLGVGSVTRAVPAAATARAAGHPAPPSRTTEPTHTTEPSHTTPTSPRPDRPAGIAHPARVVASLVAARAEAWRAGKVTGLSRSLVEHSPAYTADADRLNTAARRGVRYEGLRFTVRQANVAAATAGRAVVDARIDRSGYRVRTGQQSVAVPGDAGERVRLVLQRTRGGWRIYDWSDQVSSNPRSRRATTATPATPSTSR